MTQVFFTGDGSTREYDVTFPFLSEDDVKLSVDGVDQTITWISGSRVQLATAPASGAEVRLYRDTQIDEALVSFQDGAVLSAADLNLADTQLLYKQQELEARASAVDASIGRAIRMPVGESSDPLPAAAERANKLLRFDASGNAIAIAAAGGLGDLALPTGGSLVRMLDNLTVQEKFDILVGAGGATTIGHRIPRPNAQLANLAAGIREINVRRDYGAIADGFSHPLSERFATLEEAQEVYPHALALTDEIDWCAIQGAINDAQLGGVYRLSTVFLGEGWFMVNRGIKFKDANNVGVTVVGVPHSPLRQGSTIAPTLISYIGDTGEPIIETRGTYNMLAHLAVDNRGNAQSGLKLGGANGSGGGRNNLYYVSVIDATGTQPYTRAAVEMNTTDYTFFEYSTFASSGVPAILFDNANAPVGATKFSIRKSFITMTGTGGYAPHIKLKDASIESFTIEECGLITWFTDRESCIVDMTEIDNGTNGGAPQHVDVFNFIANELEFTTTFAASDALRLKNVYQANIANNQIMNDNGIARLFATLENSRVFARGNFFRGWPGESGNIQDKGLFKKLDSASRVFLGPNRREAGGGGWIERNAYTSAAVIPPTTSTATRVNLFLQGDKGSPDRNTTFKYTATDTKEVHVFVAQPGDSQGGHMAPGQMFTVEIVNASGGAMGAIIFDNPFKVGGAITAPGHNFRRSFTFEWDGYYAVERSRSTVDVPV